MFTKIIISVLAASLLCSASFAKELSFQEGVIGAQTEILGDSNINPKSSHISAKLSMDDTIESLKGEITLELLSLKSDNEKRDEHMHEALHVKTHPNTFFKLKEVVKESDGYHLIGILTLNNQPKEINTKADIVDQNGFDETGVYDIQHVEWLADSVDSLSRFDLHVLEQKFLV